MLNTTFKLWEIFLGVLIFVASVYVGYLVSGLVKPQEQKQEELIFKNIEQDPVIADLGRKLPTNIPPNLPLDKEVNLTTNYIQEHRNYISNTFVFVASESLKNNFEKYKTWILGEGWLITNKNETKTIANLSASKENSSLSIILTKSQESPDQTLVRVTYTVKK